MVFSTLGAAGSKDFGMCKYFLLMCQNCLNCAFEWAAGVGTSENNET